MSSGRTDGPPGVAEVGDKPKPQQPDPSAQGLTTTEHHALHLTTDLWSALCQITADGPTRDQDLQDLGTHLHAIQRTIMSQAAGRAYPARYRLLGSVIHADPS